MPPDNSRLSPALLWLIIFLASSSALAFVYFFIVPNCASLPVWGRVSGECGTKLPVIWLCSAVFLGATLYSGYRLARIMVREEPPVRC